MVTHEQGAEDARSDYERVGGTPAVRAVVDRFYELVLGDSRLANYFTDADMPRLKRHQVLLISQVLGGPAEYDGRELRQAHAGLDIGREEFHRVVVYLVQALTEAGVDREIIARVGEALSAAEDDVVATGTA